MPFAPTLVAAVEMEWFGTVYQAGDPIDVSTWDAEAVTELLRKAPVVSAASTPALGASAETLLMRTGAIAETFTRRGEGLANITITKQLLYVTALPLLAGQVVTNLTFLSGTTAMATPANWWFELLGPTFAELGITADQLAAAWAANTEKTLALAAPYTVPSSEVCYAGIMVNAATPPSLQGISTTASGELEAPLVAAFDAAHTGLTTPSSTPAPATPNTAASPLYVWAS